MSAMWFGFCGEQKNASLFCVCCLRIPSQRGFGRSDKCTKGRTGPVSLWYERWSKAAVSRNPKRPTAALGYGRCRGGMESSPFMTRRTSIKKLPIMYHSQAGTTAPLNSSLMNLATSGDWNAFTNFWTSALLALFSLAAIMISA